MLSLLIQRIVRNMCGLVTILSVGDTEVNKVYQMPKANGLDGYKSNNNHPYKSVIVIILWGKSKKDRKITVQDQYGQNLYQSLFEKQAKSKRTGYDSCGRTHSSASSPHP
jgi:hypothetical protein